MYACVFVGARTPVFVCLRVRVFVCACVFIQNFFKIFPVILELQVVQPSRLRLMTKLMF